MGIPTCASPDCASLLSGGRRKWCSEACRMRVFHAAFLDRNGEAQWARHRRTRGRKPARREIVCQQCGAASVTTNYATRFCSQRCGLLAVSAAKRDHFLPVLHPNPDPVSHLPTRHPARRPAVRHSEWWTFVVSGPCVWCGDIFTGLAASSGSAPIYCSKSCSSAAGKYRHGRFVIAPSVRLAIYERDEWVCQLCGDPVDADLPSSDLWAATLDHIVCRSWSDDPDHSPENLRLAHRWCNSVRGDESWHTADDLRVSA